MLHKLKHWLVPQRGFVVAATDKNGMVWIGYKCATCGRVTGKFAAYDQMPPDDKFT